MHSLSLQKVPASSPFFIAHISRPSDPVKYIWRRKFHLTTIPYIFCRYSLVANVLFVLAQTHKLGSSCNAWYKFDGVISVLGRAALMCTDAAAFISLKRRPNTIGSHFLRESVCRLRM